VEDFKEQKAHVTRYIELLADSQKELSNEDRELREAEEKLHEVISDLSISREEVVRLQQELTILKAQ
jgi:hypothetical protein